MPDFLLIAMTSEYTLPYFFLLQHFLFSGVELQAIVFQQLIEEHISENYSCLVFVGLICLFVESFLLIVLGFKLLRRKKSEKGLLHEINIIAAMMNSMTDHLYFKDSESRFLRVNQATADWLGLKSPNEAIGKTDFDVFDAEYAAKNAQEEQEIIQSGQPFINIEDKEIWPDGRETWVSTTKMPFCDDRGRIIGTFGISRDISLQKQAEAEQERIAERIRRQNAVLLQLATHPPWQPYQLNKALRTITEAAAAGLELSSVHIWKFSLDKRSLFCLDDFQSASQFHKEGQMLSVAQHSEVYEQLMNEEVLAIDDVADDPRAADLADLLWNSRETASSITLPIRLHSELVGLLCCDHENTLRRWSADEVHFVSQIGNLLAQVFLNTDLYRRAEEMAAIARVSREITSISKLPRVYLFIARYAVELSQADAGGVFTFRSDGRLYLDIGYGVHEQFIEEINKNGIAPGEGAIGRTVSERAPIQISDTSNDADYCFKTLADLENIRSILAVPMLRGDEIIGGVVLWQNYPRHFTLQEITFLQTLAQECVNAVENARLLEAEARRRREAETLRAAVQALSSTLDLQQVFELILTELQRVVPYDSASVQQLDGESLEIIGGRGFPNLDEVLGMRFNVTANDNPNSEVMRRQAPFILDDAPTIYQQFAYTPYVQTPIHSWLGVPLLFGERMTGMIALDKQTPGFYTQEHAQLAQAFASQAAIAVENARMFTELKNAEEALRSLNEELESRVEERTGELRQANTALRESFETLQKTLHQLVLMEKMSALGGLVAGVAHEINTPIGIGVTAASHLAGETQAMQRRYQSGELKRSDLESYLATAGQSAKMILENLQRASELIRSFKRVAVDQSSDEKRRFRLRENIEDVLLSLHPKLRKTAHRVEIDCPEELEIKSYPGAFSQILTNFVINSLLHGFEHKEQGKICLNVQRCGDSLLLKYKDNGQGISPAAQSKIFEPFYTTKRGRGGSGLGLNIVYNLITQKLRGSIECQSIPGQETQFIIRLPLEPEQ